MTMKRRSSGTVTRPRRSAAPRALFDPGSSSPSSESSRELVVEVTDSDSDSRAVIPRETHRRSLRNGKQLTADAGSDSSSSSAVKRSPARVAKQRLSRNGGTPVRATRSARRTRGSATLRVVESEQDNHSSGSSDEDGSGGPLRTTHATRRMRRRGAARNAPGSARSGRARDGAMRKNRVAVGTSASDSDAPRAKRERAPQPTARRSSSPPAARAGRPARRAKQVAAKRLSLASAEMELLDHQLADPSSESDDPESHSSSSGSGSGSGSGSTSGAPAMRRIRVRGRSHSARQQGPRSTRERRTQQRQVSSSSRSRGETDSSENRRESSRSGASSSSSLSSSSSSASSQSDDSSGGRARTRRARSKGSDHESEEDEARMQEILSMRFRKDSNAREFFVKWEGYSYRDCEWISEADAQRLAPQRVRAFLRRDPEGAGSDSDHGIESEWLEIDRVFSHSAPRGTNVAKYETIPDNVDDWMYLVKWKGLQHSEGSWEEGYKISKTAADRAALLRYHQRLHRYLTAQNSAQAHPAPRRRLGKFTGLQEQPSYLVGGVLRDYQLEGISWMWYAWRKKRSVVLGDEMGLGKTVQTVGLVSVVRREEADPRPALIVVPLSTLRHWMREFSLWAPDLHVVEYYGDQDARQLIKENELIQKRNISLFDVAITSNETVLADATVFRRFRWSVVVVDEGHRLKGGRKSRLFRDLLGASCDQRILLTGTPLQNNLMELYNLLHFLSPDKFSSFEDFEAQFDVADSEKLADLHARLRPHMLRRLKKNVIRELPQKKELIVPVTMTSMQRKYYTAILEKNFNILHHALPQSQRRGLHNVLAELRKCCNHPYLFPGTEPEDIESEDRAFDLLVAASAKFMFLESVLPVLKERGHRVLIFSQSTRLLDVLEDYMNHREYEYERLDGSVSSAARQASIDRFNEPDSELFCFMLSTRAGGLGINLATADTVIIFDPDWNPHADLQALSRAHRLGQQNKVLILRLVTRFSVEENIIACARDKLVLERVVVGNVERSNEQMSSEDLAALVRKGAAELFKDDSASRQIVYDAAAVDRLLDRSIPDENDASDGDSPKKGDRVESFLDSFNVAQVWEEEQNVKLGEVDEQADRDLWEGLLRNRFEEQQAQEVTELGRGKRERRQVSYNENDFFSVLDSPVRKRSRAGSKGKKPAPSAEDGEREAPAPADEDYKPLSQSSSDSDMEGSAPQPGRANGIRHLSGHVGTSLAAAKGAVEDGGSRAPAPARLPLQAGNAAVSSPVSLDSMVMDLSLHQRNSFVLFVLAWGIPEGPLWEKLAMQMRTVPLATLKRFSQYFVLHLVHSTVENLVTLRAAPERQTTLSKLLEERTFVMLAAREVRERWQRELGALRREGEAGAALMPPLAQSWNDFCAAALLAALGTHGYGAWTAILLDGEYSIAVVLQKNAALQPTDWVPFLERESLRAAHTWRSQRDAFPIFSDSV